MSFDNKICGKVSLSGMFARNSHLDNKIVKDFVNDDSHIGNIDVLIEDFESNIRKTLDVIYVSNNEAVATVDENGLVTGVAKGTTKISVFKEGYKAVRLEVTVTEKALAGEIKVEAEDCITDETSGITSRKVSSGETATDTFDEGAVLTVKFNVQTAGVYDLYIAVRGNSSSKALDIAAGLGLKFNDQEITYEASITGRSFQTLKIATVQAIVGENTLLVTGLSGTRANIDFFKLAPTAAPNISQIVS